MLVGRRGARKLRPLLGLWRPELNRIRSVYEGLFLLAWIDRGYHLPLINEKIGGKEVDCYWPDQGFVLKKNSTEALTIEAWPSTASTRTSRACLRVWA